MGKLVVSLSPHAHGTDTVERNMYGVIIALIPALLVSFYFFGMGSAVVLATSVAACVLLEWAINKFMLKNPRNTVLDGSAVLTGLLLGFNLPSNLPIWIIIIGAIFAIGFAKMPFGGLGNNLFNPALVGRAALLVAFPAQMTTWPKVGQLGSYLDAETGATPLSLMKEAIKTGDASVLDQLPSTLDLFIGAHPDGAGALGEICALALLLYPSAGRQGAAMTEEEQRVSATLSRIAGAGEVRRSIYSAQTASAFGGSGQKTPVGAVIVARGAGDVAVRLNLLRAAETLLGLDANRVDVFLMEEKP